MSITSEISRITSLKTAILSAIRAKGVAVSSSAALEDCPGYIERIPVGDTNRVGIAMASNDSNNASLSFTGLTGTPVRFSVVAMEAVNSIVTSSGLFSRTYRPCLIAAHYDGETISGNYTTSSSYNQANQFSDTACSQSFEGETLTLTLNGAYFPSGVTYNIFYEF